MFHRYNLNMSRQQQQLMMAWSKQYPVTEWERKRNERISKIAGYSNQFVTGKRTGDSVASLLAMGSPIGGLLTQRHENNKNSRAGSSYHVCSCRCRRHG